LHHQTSVTGTQALNFKLTGSGKVRQLQGARLRVAMLSVHSSPMGELGTKDTGGMSVYIRELARELGSLGHQVDIFTRLPDPGYDQIITLHDNVRLVHLRVGRDGYLHQVDLYPYLADFFQQLETMRAHEGASYDLIHSHYWLSGRVGDWARKRWGVPHIIMFHTLGAVKNATVEVEQEPALRIATERRLVRMCQRILAATEREKDQLIGYYGASAERISVVPCGVNLERFRPLSKISARRSLGYGAHEAVVLFVGRLAPVKGIDRLLTAFSYLANQNESLRLVVIGGDGQHTPELRELVRLSRRLGIERAVTFAGRVAHEDLPPYYAAADVLVLSSHYESFGLVALESLASGTPVVATPVGAMESIIRDGKTGRVVPSDDARALADGIQELIGKSHAGMLSRVAIRSSVVRFGWANVTAAVLEEYGAVLLHQQGPYWVKPHRKAVLLENVCV
jgi:D-inositol-3-phosphate glycosyltransferase